MEESTNTLNIVLNNRYFSRCFKLAKNHINSEPLVSYHAAIVVRGGAVLGWGVNSTKRDKLVRLHYEYFCGSHAELDALRRTAKYSEDLKGSVVYVIRVKKDGSVSNSKPCDVCKKILAMFGVKKVYYSTDFGYESMKV